MSFTEASKLVSRYRQLMIGNYHTPGNKSAFVLPAVQDASLNKKRYYVKGTVNRNFLELEIGSGTGLFETGLHSQFHLVWNEKRDFYKTRWFFHRKSSSKYAIRYGEPLAIQLKFWVGGGRGDDYSSYIKYGRRVGAIIRHAKTKSFEWALIGGKPGEPIRTGDVVVLYNLKRQQPLIYFRGKGNDVGWPDSADIKDSPQQTAKKRAAAKALLMPGVIVGK
jgi:hypothetical protein